MIYAGTGTTAPQTTGIGTQLSSEGTGFAPTGTYDTCVGEMVSNNYCFGDNAYVGYMFHGNTSTASTSYDDAHSMSSGTITDSNVKTVIDTWYESTNLEDLRNTYIDESAGFCGDRSSSTSETGPAAQSGGYGEITTYYGAYYRNRTKKAPSFKCTYASNDLYTTKGDQIKKGNQKLTYPIGLITADEVAFAGGVNERLNKSYYLYTGSEYWTMSPSFFDFSGYVFSVGDGGDLYIDLVPNSFGVRPVINLKADVTISGSGTTSSPYTVS